MSELSGAVVMVAGSSGVLGGLIAERLEAAGATVIAATRTPRVGELTLDLQETGNTASAIEAVRQSGGQLDGVVIAAGVVAFGPAETVTDATLSELFEVNALGPIRLIRDATPLLTESAAAGRSPFIVTLSGVVAEAPTAGIAAYSAAKSALSSFVTATTRELRRAGIRMIDARPGHTETGLASRAIQGTAPAFPTGHDPAKVADRIVRAIVDDEKDLPSTSFA